MSCQHLPNPRRAERAGWPKETAAASVCVSLRAWQAYESGAADAAATWVLFTLLNRPSDPRVRDTQGARVLRSPSKGQWTATAGSP